MTKYVHLLESFVPRHYDLMLDLDNKKLQAKGKVTIFGAPVKKTSTLDLHSKAIEIHKITVNNKVATWTEGARDVLTVKTKQQLETEELEITIDFTAPISETMHGIYPAPFTLNGKEDMLVSTQFESHHAREAFPCIDEPNAKATFDLTLKTAPSYTALSNMEPIKTTKTKTKKTTVFGTTPIMSTYLLAFVVGNIKSKEAKTKDGVVVRTWSTPEFIDQTQFALETAVKGLEFYSDYFGIPYPLEKCDNVAIPNFNSGAMENWGLITYREAAFFVDPKHTRLGAKQRIAETVTHELAHQWFGNLVTMQWWTDLWLNEAFASWAANYSLEQLFPEWKYWEQFIAGDLIYTLSEDTSTKGRPIESAIEDPDEIRSLFDTISYCKGPVVVSMLHDFMGAENFRTGITYYFNKHKYDNATTADLWNDLEEASGLPVKSFMTAWTSQAGYPYVEANVKDGYVELSQHRFLYNTDDKDEDSIWPIAIKSNASDRVFLFKDESITWETDASSDTFKINHDQAGLYVVKYDEDHLKKLVKALSGDELSALDKLGVLHDTFHLAKIGVGKTVDGLALLEGITDEESLSVWSIIASELGEIRQVMDNDTLIDKLRPFVGELIKTQHKRLGFDKKSGESHFDTLLRPSILGLAAFSKDKKVLDWAHDQFDSASSSSDLEPDLRSVILSAVASNGGKAEFAKMLDFYSQANQPHDLMTMSAALSSFKDEKLIMQAQAMIREQVKLQDVGYWMAYGFSNRHAKNLMWQWVDDNWDWLFENFGEDIGTLSWIPSYSSSNFSTESFLKEYKSFFKDRATVLIKRDVELGEDRLKWQIKWRKAQEKSILKFLS